MILLLVSSEAIDFQYLDLHNLKSVQQTSCGYVVVISKCKTMAANS